MFNPLNLIKKYMPVPLAKVKQQLREAMEEQKQEQVKFIADLSTQIMARKHQQLIDLAGIAQRFVYGKQLILTDRDFEPFRKAHEEFVNFCKEGNLCYPELFTDPNPPKTAGVGFKHVCIACIKVWGLKTADGIPLGNAFMVLCPLCGNKRCPMASNHRNPCTGSNAPGQPGSVYTS